MGSKEWDTRWRAWSHPAIVADPLPGRDVLSGLGLNVLLIIPNSTGLLGAYIQGKKLRVGWIIGVTSEIAWVVWGIAAHSLVIVPFALIWTVVFVVNWRRWRPQVADTDAWRVWI